jgi:hypothetical protein
VLPFVFSDHTSSAQKGFSQCPASHQGSASYQGTPSGVPRSLFLKKRALAPDEQKDCSRYAFRRAPH